MKHSSNSIRGRLSAFAAVLMAVILTFTFTVPADMAFASGTGSLGGAEVPDKFKEGYRVENCLDISIWNKEITDNEWKILKEKGVTAVIIRAGYSRLYTGFHSKDSTFEANMKGAKKAGMKIGVYYFTTAVNENEARKEAQYFAKIIEEYREDITLPVVYDFESNEGGRLNGSRLRSLGKEGCTNLCLAFCETMESYGYEAMIYANRATFDNYLDMDVIEGRYRLWLAQFTSGGSATGYDGHFDMWQYSSSVRINGIDCTFDANYLFERKAVYEETTIADSEGGSDSGNQTTFTLSKGVRSVVPLESTGDKANVKVKDSSGLTHQYKIYKSTGNNEEDCIMACLLSGYFASSHLIDPDFFSNSVAPVTVDSKYQSKTKDGKSISMQGICKTLTDLKLQATYVREIDDKVFTTIKSHLAKGKPVILSIKDPSSRWSNGNELVLLLGMDENGYAIMADPKDRNWSKSDQRVKLVNADELIEELQSSGSSDSLMVEGYDQQGGFILVDIQ